MTRISRAITMGYPHHITQRGNYLQHVKVVLLILMIGISLRANYVRADCLACFELKGVQIEMKNGNTHRGYVPWNPVWFKERENAKFPDSLLSSESWQYTPLEALRLYTRVYKVKHPLPILVTTSTDSITLSLSDIKKIVPAPQEHDGYQGASGLPALSQTAIRLLSEEEPYALLKDDSGVTDIYLISFNQNIDTEKLKQIHDALKSISPQKVTEQVNK